ncbi:Holliday junction branch migration protein RuvA [Facklamia sp. DSM 111018]|uniref:Holliday junction branch migration complex subunit RuvA n=1 Tax=Facklamia lactis TaxID=2749967 RepID=A0ABS0LN04_9LACT|nr:Holliday junction branch migration protein RuvA [Facklamia lactis]MBG9979827.1 Holliday junction branch migration protein RuvA [Facklamia lactis]MBG9985493.1 Holliday junction branch migration protein RuvA [Facklamia lactis]
MYQYITGTIQQITPTYLIIDNTQIGYQIWCANPFRWQEQLGECVTIYLELVVREDSMLLYGFKNQEEKDLFLQLNRVSGIGPKSALSILALDDHEGLVAAIENADAKYLMKFPGVGKKTAQQMILDLQGKIALDVTEIKQETISSDIEEVTAALVGLGYSQREINKVKPLIEQESFTNTQEALSFAFKMLIK